MSDMEHIRNWTIYKITSPSGRVYIGKTCNYRNRINQYKTKFAKSQPLLHNSISKYGLDNHKIEVIDTFSGDLDYSSGKEIFWIRSYMSEYHKFKDKNGLNLTRGGEGFLGRVVSDEQRKRSSEARKAKLTDEERDRLRKMSYEISLKPSPRLGKKHTEKVKRYISSIHKGNKYNIGKVRSEEYKKKLSEINKGKSVGRKYFGEKLDNIRISAFGRRKPVLQFDLTGNFITEHISLADAVRNTNIPMSTMLHIINGRIPKPKNYLFKYK